MSLYDDRDLIARVAAAREILPGLLGVPPAHSDQDSVKEIEATLIKLKEIQEDLRSGGTVPAAVSQAIAAITDPPDWLTELFQPGYYAWPQPWHELAVRFFGDPRARERAQRIANRWERVKDGAGTMGGVSAFDAVAYRIIIKIIHNSPKWFRYLSFWTGAESAIDGETPRTIGAETSGRRTKRPPAPTAEDLANDPEAGTSNAPQVVQPIDDNFDQGSHPRRGEIETPHEDAARKEDTYRVRWAVRHLPGKERAPVVSYYFEGMKKKDICELLDISQPTLNARLKAGLDRLPLLLRNYDRDKWAVQQLSRPQRDLVELVHLHGQNLDEAGERLGFSLAEARQLLADGMAQIERFREQYRGPRTDD